MDGNSPERSNYIQVELVERLRQAINRLNPQVPLVAREDALQQVMNLDTPVLLAANRQFHHLLVNGVLVEYQKDGETRGDFVRLIDFADADANKEQIPDVFQYNEVLVISDGSDALLGLLPRKICGD